MSLSSAIFVLAPDNFTSLEKTPWAGDGIAKLKFPNGGSGEKIGESWEFSFDQAMPSRVAGENTTLAAAIAKSGAILTAPADEWLIKLVNAAEPLSVQVHPDNNAKSLRADECGKFESWYIVDGQAGAGVYLGFKQGVTERDVRNALAAPTPDLAPLLNFVPVSAGQYINVPPGTVHAVGPGTVILEPQVVVPGKSAKTLRLWDWNRTYDAAGKASPLGKPRQVHIEEALAVTNWRSNQPTELFAQAKVATPQPGISIRAFPPSETYRLTVADFAQKNRATLRSGAVFGLVLRGNIQVNGRTVAQGTSFFAPSAAFEIITDATAQLALISAGAAAAPTLA